MIMCEKCNSDKALYKAQTITSNGISLWLCRRCYWNRRSI